MKFTELISTLVSLMSKLEKMNKQIVLSIAGLSQAINRVADILENDDGNC